MGLQLNTMKPAAGAKKAKVRVGRGIGSGMGKTAGRGHKGQTSRSGYSRKMGFEGGQMPLQRRLPKFGFTSKMKAFSQEVRLGDLDEIKAEKIDLNTLKDVGAISDIIKKAKIILSGKISKPVHISGIKVTKGAKKAIEAAGGTIVE